ncbi:TPA: hypothetical protein NJ528_004456 [Vibrio parahaemolyticus]|uniref:hypothetical protein n=1 Tax=Vibrio TaxID=662 RepID=UPI00102BC06C|nr:MULTISPECIES: hypothetical protein [Vibrio]EJG1033348.1 hypothetical protein [Vibrio parahaemolyticus]EJG1726550.1 hypothetical protein [Vibrio parahaemolyticus]EJG1740232.1 hypothetical protein [Vibrio parahaemolyticus]EJG1754382.1 hypothetical protein [Vibrio parahaemolyticus]EJG1758932.1 hypothetical protein [Vibrio parahaemolyticus]
MNAFLIIVVITCGYIVSRYHMPWRYVIARVSGWSYYSFVVARGALVYLFSHFMLLMLIKGFSIDYLSECSGAYSVACNYLTDTSNYESNVYLVSILISLFFILASQAVYSLKFMRLNLIAKLVESDNRRGFILEAIATSNPILVSMNSRKCYVGICLGEDFTNQDNEYISILPLLSGFRNESDLTLKITTNNYSHFIDSNILSENSVINQNDFKLVVSMKEVESIQFFSMNRYMKEELECNKNSN